MDDNTELIKLLKSLDFTLDEIIEYKDNIHSDFVISRFYFKLDENNNLIILDIND